MVPSPCSCHACASASAIAWFTRASVHLPLALVMLTCFTASVVPLLSLHSCTVAAFLVSQHPRPTEWSIRANRTCEGAGWLRNAVLVQQAEICLGMPKGSRTGPSKHHAWLSDSWRTGCGLHRSERFIPFILAAKNSGGQCPTTCAQVRMETGCCTVGHGGRFSVDCSVENDNFDTAPWPA